MLDLDVEGFDGSERIAHERRRQVASEGYTAEHDRDHAMQLALAGSAYADAVAHRGAAWMADWPWALEFWKPTGDDVRDLTKAGALIAAAIDSILAARTSSEAHTKDAP